MVFQERRGGEERREREREGGGNEEERGREGALFFFVVKTLASTVIKSRQPSIELCGTSALKRITLRSCYCLLLFVTLAHARSVTFM